MKRARCHSARIRRDRRALTYARTPAPEIIMNDETTAPQANGKTSLADALRAHSAGDAPLTEKAVGFAKARLDERGVRWRRSTCFAQHAPRSRLIAARSEG